MPILHSAQSHRDYRRQSAIDGFIE